ncbi:MAG: hypothetical protein Q4D17_00110, partial [Planctomycetia bacterium]|nr:hypothetical protein [Planctomycetia bacterium]
GGTTQKSQDPKEEKGNRMSKYLYNNTVTVPNSGTDTISDGSTVGGDIVSNFKAIADIVHNSDSGVNVGGWGNAAGGSYSITVGGSYNQVGGGGNSAVIVGGDNNSNNGNCSAILAGYYNCNSGSNSAVIGQYCTNSQNGCLAVNNDAYGLQIGGVSIFKSLSVPANQTYESWDVNRIAQIPSGGMGIFHLDILNPSAGTIESTTLKVYPSSYGTLVPESSTTTGISFYFSGTDLYVYNSNSDPVQVGIRGTIVGAGANYYDSSYDSGSY